MEDVEEEAVLDLASLGAVIEVECVSAHRVNQHMKL